MAIYYLLICYLLLSLFDLPSYTIFLIKLSSGYNFIGNMYNLCTVYNFIIRFINESFILIRVICHALFSSPNVGGCLRVPKTFFKLSRNVSVNIFLFLTKYSFSASRLNMKTRISQCNFASVFYYFSFVSNLQTFFVQIIIHLHSTFWGVT